MGRRRNLLIGDVFTNAARAVPGRLAVALGDRSLSFAALDRASNQVARALSAMGVGRGSRVALWCVTDIDAVPVFAGVAKLGGVFVPVNGLLGDEEAAPILSTCRPHLLVVGAGRSASAAAAALSVPVVSLADLVRRAESQGDSEVACEGLSDDETHSVFFTSGSTGSPKGAVLSHETNYLRSHPGALLEQRGAMVCPYPLFHMGAWTIALQQWQARDAVILVDAADAGPICEAVERHGATRLNCIPAVWRRILAHLEGSPGHPLSSIRVADSGTSATPPELLEAIAEALPQAHRRVFYGSTEAGSVACLDHRDMDRKPGSCGPPAPGVRVRIADDGELWVRSVTMFDGYLDDPAATAECLVDGWYGTGDLADQDDEGYLSIVGRARDLIRSGGESVVPVEVEAVLLQHRAVADVAVIGVADPVWGEVVCAVVVVAPGEAAPGIAALRAHCAGRLAAFKHPRRVTYRDVLPRTASTGQVQRPLLAGTLAAAPTPEDPLENSVLRS